MSCSQLAANFQPASRPFFENKRLSNSPQPTTIFGMKTPLARLKWSFNRRNGSFKIGLLRAAIFAPNLAPMNSRIWQHLAFWLVWWLASSWLSAPFSSQSHLPFWQKIGIGLAVEGLLMPFRMAAVYWTLYRLLPRFFEKKDRFVLVLEIIGGLIFLIGTCRLLVDGYISPNFYHRAVSENQPFWQYFNQWLFTFLDFLAVTGLAVGLRLARQRRAAVEREQQLRTEKLEAELHFLRAQTSPHFLFNTLNNIFHLARRNDPATADVVLKLADLLRYLLYECTSLRVEISQEIRVIEQYIDLEKLRFSRPLAVVFEKNMDEPGAQIAPLLLLPLVENAFKHGAAETRDAPEIFIFLNLKNGRLDFKIENSMPADGPLPGSEGIGLRNVRRQLELVYPDSSFDFGPLGNGRFQVKMSLHLASTMAFIPSPQASQF